MTQDRPTGGKGQWDITEHPTPLQNSPRPLTQPLHYHDEASTTVHGVFGGGGGRRVPCPVVGEGSTGGWLKKWGSV